MTIEKKQTLIQFIKYAMVGCLNTAVTLGVIYVCNSLLSINLYAANAIGYVAGLINSFIWNKNWVFKSHNEYKREAMKFAFGFGICYLLQLLVVYLLATDDFSLRQWEILGFFTLSGKGVATIIGNIVYTLANFIYNRLVTFK